MSEKTTTATEGRSSKCPRVAAAAKTGGVVEGERANAGARKSYARSPPRARRRGASQTRRVAKPSNMMDSMWQTKKISTATAQRTWRRKVAPLARR